MSSFTAINYQNPPRPERAARRRSDSVSSTSSDSSSFPEITFPVRKSSGLKDGTHQELRPEKASQEPPPGDKNPPPSSPAVEEPSDLCGYDWEVKSVIEKQQVGDSLQYLVSWAESTVLAKDIRERPGRSKCIRCDGRLWNIVDATPTSPVEGTGQARRKVQWENTWRELRDVLPNALDAVEEYELAQMRKRSSRPETGGSTIDFWTRGNTNSRLQRSLLTPPVSQTRSEDAIRGCKLYPERGNDYNGPLRSYITQTEPEWSGRTPLFGLLMTTAPVRSLTVRDTIIDKHGALDIVRKRVAILAYTVGYEQSVPCERCGRNLGPFPKCVVFSDTAGGCCTNCAYGKTPAKCNFHHDPHEEVRQRFAQQRVHVFTPDATPNGMPSSPASEPSKQLVDRSSVEPSNTPWAYTPRTSPVHSPTLASTATPADSLSSSPAVVSSRYHPERGDSVQALASSSTPTSPYLGVSSSRTAPAYTGRVSVADFRSTRSQMSRQPLPSIESDVETVSDLEQGLVALSPSQQNTICRTGQHASSEQRGGHDEGCNSKSELRNTSKLATSQRSSSISNKRLPEREPGSDRSLSLKRKRSSSVRNEAVRYLPTSKRDFGHDACDPQQPCIDPGASYVDESWELFDKDSFESRNLVPNDRHFEPTEATKEEVIFILGRCCCAWTAFFEDAWQRFLCDSDNAGSTDGTERPICDSKEEYISDYFHDYLNGALDDPRAERSHGDSTAERDRSSSPGTKRRWKGFRGTTGDPIVLDG